LTIDITALDAYREVMGDDADAFIADVIDTYLNSAAGLISTLHSCLSSNDEKTFERAAHTLKSTSATVGATDLSALASELEKLSKSDPLPVLASKVQAAGEEFAKAEVELKAIREKLGH
jgi:HPt (histidine-containing phosphotransfer) domain-containing protein